jgi:plastocyanin
MNLAALVVPLALAVTAAQAADTAVTLTINNHRFTPAEIHVKANTPTTVTLINNDSATEEFDSTSLKIEKVVAGHTTGTMRWRPFSHNAT